MATNNNHTQKFTSQDIEPVLTLEEIKQLRELFGITDYVTSFPDRWMKIYGTTVVEKRKNYK